MSSSIHARTLTVSGKVQGVGFRPFVYQLSTQLGLTGWVENRCGEVAIWWEGIEASLDAAIGRLITEAPPLAQPVISQIDTATSVGFARFEIRASCQSEHVDIHLPADFFMCPKCQAELTEKGNRRHEYPFINCTHCGPRYTIIEALPYDRPSTTMAGFPLCEACASEYSNPGDRRFHAQPIACPDCGPQLEYIEKQQKITENTEAIAATVSALRRGCIIAVKGIGGYHLLADALNDEAIARLRARKQRPDKPFAVMFPWLGGDGTEDIQRYTTPSSRELALLCSHERPIVLVEAGQEQRAQALSRRVSGALGRIGVMLPYSPLHFLLLRSFNGPLVATSGNISGEPVIIDNRMAEQRLARFADAMLHHNRPIVRPADDSVVQVIANRQAPIRLGRGTAPLEGRLPFTLDEPVVAFGAQQKNTLCLAWRDRFVLSPHIGDMGARRSLEVLQGVCDDLSRLYQVKPKQCLIDHHPSYSYRRIAERNDWQVHKVWHHHAHASALCAEHCADDWLIFSWDGVGFGPDKTLWGGEAFTGQPGNWARIATIQPFRLPGGDKVFNEPWRVAAALLWEAGIEEPRALPEQAVLLERAWANQIQSPQTSSIGRLFDGVAWLLGIVDDTSFDGQAPMLLQRHAEAFASKATPADWDRANSMAESSITRKDEFMKLNWSDWLAELCYGERSVNERAWYFHALLVEYILIVAHSQSVLKPAIGLTGGVFQNRLLVNMFSHRAKQYRFDWYTGRQYPVNDGALSLGQVLEWGAMRT
ncbi:MAG: carbamoyltransferase HypF [Kangiellaceae bacterium]|nr:carbamoyltransferase HypF [Kangiellaceae bacterium]